MNTAKKLISVILCCILMLSVFVPAASAQELRNVPIVFVGGRGTTLHDKDCNQIYPMDFDKKQYILDACKEIFPLLGTAVLTNNYNRYCDAFYETFSFFTALFNLLTDAVRNGGIKKK